MRGIFYRLQALAVDLDIRLNHKELHRFLSSLDLCGCGHTREAHTHLHENIYCGKTGCECDRFEEPRGLFRRLISAA
jgi:hypothetical protein